MRILINLIKILCKKSVNCDQIRNISAVMADSIEKSTATSSKFAIEHEESAVTKKRPFLDDEDEKDIEKSVDSDQGMKKAKTEGSAESESKPRKGRKDHGRTGPMVNRPEFFYENGLKKVLPYWFRHVTYIKRRWVGRTLADVFNEEMYAKDPNGFMAQISLGRVTINDKPANADQILKDNDVLKHIMHRHEMPVLEKPVEIVLNDDEVVVVNKPCSLPTHPCGRYHFNSLSYTLENHFGFSGLRIAHRLDRLTSGLVIFAKTLSKCQELFVQISNREVRKEYIARVDGVFPDDEICCEEPVGPLFEKMGVHCISTANGKPSRTRFQKIFSDGQQSVVRCLPETGRTHQIRVHLQYIGYPIVNDYMYNNEVFGPEKGKGGQFGKPLDQLCKDLGVVFGGASWIDDFDNSLSTYLDNRPATSADAPSATPDMSSPYYDPYCVDCHLKSRDPTAEQLEMYLHCLKYDVTIGRIQHQCHLGRYLRKKRRNSYDNV